MSDVATITSDTAAKHVEYGIILVVSSTLVIVQFYATIFGHRMRLHPLRWHTFNVSVWSMYQLFIFTDQSMKSPWRGFLHNGDISLNRAHMEMMTLTVFPASMCFIVPAALVAHWKPRIKESLGFQWVFWIFVIFLVNSAAIVTYFCSEWRQIDASAGRKELVAVELYQAIVVVLFSVTMAYLSVAFLVSFILWLKATFQGRAKALNVGSRLVELLFLLAYTIVVGLVHLPTNVQNMLPFIIENLTPLMTHAMLASGRLPDVPQIAITMLAVKEDSELFIPLTIFFATAICVPMYREEYLHLLSCGQFYSTKEHGDLWSVFSRTRKVQPSDAQRSQQNTPDTIASVETTTSRRLPPIQTIP